MLATTRSLLFAIPLLLTVTACDWRAVTGVTWNDIHSWKGLGNRWALAHDRSGKRIAIYDLSYPDLRRQLELGFAGTKRVRVKDLVDELEKAITGSEEGDDRSKVLRQLRTLNQGEYLDHLPDDWFRHVPWRAEFIARSGGRVSEAPPGFTLDDLDLESASVDPHRFRQLVAELEEEREAPDQEPILGKGFLRHFQFVRVPGGGYRLLFNPPWSGSATSRPQKLIDLTLVHSGIVEKSVWQGVKTGINQIVGLIPIPVVSGLIQTIFGRWFHAREQTWNLHLDMLVEMARVTEDGEPSPLGDLTATELLEAAKSLTLSRASLAAIPTWLWRHPEDAWRKAGEDDHARASRASRQLELDGFRLEALGPRFTLALRDGRQHLYTLPLRANWMTDAPTLTLDYSDPFRQRERREFIEALSTGVSFATKMIPVIGGGIGWVYGQLIENPLDRAKAWDGRLKIALLEGPQAGTRDWSRELAMIDEQKVNPLELDVTEARNEIAARRMLLGLEP
ncbi:MAG TPA: hypothetical protein VM598_04970 [Bdellovibrionota bacterium]|nr:hypothetical protein [Bdellovibrionota bacterium]